MKLGFKLTAPVSILGSILGAILSLNLIPALMAQAPAQQPIPDAPAPQAPVPLSEAASGPIKPGGGAGTETNPTTSGSANADQPPAATPPPAPPVQPRDVQTSPPNTENPEQLGTILRLNVTYVEVPVTVKDSKGHQVAGLTWRDFKVYENNNYEPLKEFFVTPREMSIVFVVDQSLPKDQMAQVNQSLGAIQGALTPYDEIAVYTYSNGPQDQSHGFTGAQTTRVPYILSMTKGAGTEQLNAVNDGPLAGCPIRQNGNCVDPNIQPGRSTGNDTFITIPKEIHTLNDAILAAGRELSNRPKERRRLIFVISDGKEYGSKAKYSDVLHYLETNNIAVYGTLVGDAARWGEGRMSRFHLPFTMYDNLLVKYTLATGGTLDSEHGTNNIEKSYASLAEEARNQYTLVYASHEPLIDGKFRKIDVRVDRPNLEVAAKTGYYPAAQDQR